MPYLARFLITSLLIHLLLLFIFKLPDFQKDKEPEATALEIELQGMRNRRLADIIPPPRPERPDKAKFFGAYDSKVEEEQVTTEARRGNEPSPQINESKRRDLASLYDFEQGLFLQQEKKKEEKKKLLGEALPEDYFPDYKRGKHTYLNVHRYPHAEYFVRLKRIFKVTWDPVSALRGELSTQIRRGRIEVVLGITVDTKGELAELFVLKSSGLRRYDQEALRTVRASSPFSTPPEAFLADDNLLRMSWAFIYF